MSLDARFSLQQGTFSLAAALQVAAGETVALVGPNGAGKSTTLRALAGIHGADHGHIRVAGALVDDGSAASFVSPDQRNVGVVFQDHLLFPHMSARENICFGLRSRGMKRKLARAVADTWLERVGLAGRGDARPAALSGGQAQRVALARALANDPEILLADEPTGNLDPDLTVEIMDLIVGASLRGTTVIVATHDLSLIERYAKRTLRLEAGRLVEDTGRGGGR